MPAEESVQNEIQITINGQSRQFSSKTTLKTLLESFQISGSHFAVALNNEVIPHSLMAEKQIEAGDRIEIIRAVAGG